MPARKAASRRAAPRQSGSPRKPSGNQRAKRKVFRGAALRQQAAVVLDRLLRAYPNPHCALDFANAYQLLCATILSAQCTDKRVNIVTPGLFARYADAFALAPAKPEDVEAIIKSTGFFRSKAKSLVGMAAGLVERHDGAVPADMDALVQLPGVGRKTANVILGNAFGRNDGIVVDTHVMRLSNRLGLTSETDAVRIEQALLPLFPQQHWTMISHLLIEHGRQVCLARTPHCHECVLADVCPSALV